MVKFPKERKSEYYTIKCLKITFTKIRPAEQALHVSHAAHIGYFEMQHCQYKDVTSNALYFLL